MLPEQRAAQLYVAGRLVDSVRLQLQLQLEQSLHLGQLQLEKQSSVIISNTKNHCAKLQTLLESGRDLSVCAVKTGFIYLLFFVVPTILV